jgi:hypothetical protein
VVTQPVVDANPIVETAPADAEPATSEEEEA